MERWILFLIGAAIGAGSSLLTLPGYAQNYPTKPVRIVVAFLAGGADDFVARVVAPKLSDVLGQQVIVENRPGAGGLIGWEYVARSAPDGYTLALGGGSMIVSAALRAKPPYDVLRDFTPVALISTTSYVLVVHPSVPARTGKELVALARAHPGQLNYASPGVGTLGHLAGELFKSMARLDVVHVSYKGASSIYADLVSGQVHMYFAPPASAIPHVQNGKVRALGVTGARRVAVLPDVPTIAETVLPGYELTGWNALHGPAGIPRNAVNRLNAAIHDVVATPDVRERLSRAGPEPQTNTPEQIAGMVKAGVEKFGNIIRAIGIKPE